MIARTRALGLGRARGGVRWDWTWVPMVRKGDWEGVWWWGVWVCGRVWGWVGGREGKGLFGPEACTSVASRSMMEQGAAIKAVVGLGRVANAQHGVVAVHAARLARNTQVKINTHTTLEAPRVDFLQTAITSHA